MDIFWFFYFLAKHSFWSQVLISSIGAFVGFILALWLYYRRQQEDKSKEIRKANETNKRISEYHNSLSNSVVEVIEKQIQLIKEYEEKQAQDFIEYKQPQLVTTQHFQRLIMISKDVFYSLESKNKQKGDEWIQNLKDLYKQIDLLEGLLKDIERIVSEAGREYVENHKKVQKLVDDSADDLSKLQMHLETQQEGISKKHKIYDYIKKYISIYNHIVEKQENLSYINKYYLRDFLQEFVDGYKNKNPEITRIAFNMKNTRFVIGAIRDANKQKYFELRRVSRNFCLKISKIQKINNQLFCED
ncbi:MAG: hypothetical protein K9I29_01450 [Bacteroidales bacterium]|nr:hypothetical protein [Bacteroidales bacterium]MCF8326935.1 hypothetical protein [Bacteroidales bacterium]